MFDTPQSAAAIKELVAFVNKQGLAYEEVRLYDDVLIGVAAFRAHSTLHNNQVDVSDDLLMCTSVQHQMVYGALPFTRIARADEGFDLMFPSPWAARPIASVWSSNKKEVLAAIPLWSYQGIPNASAKLGVDFHTAWRKAIDRLDKRQLYYEFGGKLGSDFASKHGWGP